MSDSSVTDPEDDFPSIYYLDSEQGSPVTRRWPELNPFHYYIDGIGMAQPYPDKLGKPEVTEAVTRKPPALPKELTIDPYISPHANTNFSSGSLPSPRCTNIGGTKPTILQRRRYQLGAKNIRQPLMFLIDNEGEVNQPHLITNIDREEHKEAARRDDQYQYGYGRHDQPWATRDEEYKYLDSIEDYDQMLRTWHAGINATRLLPEDDSWVWVDFFQPDDDLEPYIMDFEMVLDKANEVPRYWYEPKIGDVGIPDQCALNYVLGVRKKTENFRDTIKAGKMSPTRQDCEAAVCVPLPPRRAPRTDPPLLLSTPSYSVQPRIRIKVPIEDKPRNMPLSTGERVIKIQIKRQRRCHDEYKSKGGLTISKHAKLIEGRPKAKMPKIKLVGAWAARRGA